MATEFRHTGKGGLELGEVSLPIRVGWEEWREVPFVGLGNFSAERSAGRGHDA